MCVYLCVERGANGYYISTGYYIIPIFMLYNKVNSGMLGGGVYM